jgi:hypothetical protein
MSAIDNNMSVGRILSNFTTVTNNNGATVVSNVRYVEQGNKTTVSEIRYTYYDTRGKEFNYPPDNKGIDIKV